MISKNILRNFLTIVLFVVIAGSVALFSGCKEDDEPEIIDYSDAELYVNFSSDTINLSWDGENSCWRYATPEMFSFRITRRKLNSYDEEIYLDTIYGDIKWPIMVETGWIYRAQAEYVFRSETVMYEKKQCSFFRGLTTDEFLNYEIPIPHNMRAFLKLDGIQITRWIQECYCFNNNCPHTKRIPFTNVDPWSEDYGSAEQDQYL